MQQSVPTRMTSPTRSHCWPHFCPQHKQMAGSRIADQIGIKARQSPIDLKALSGLSRPAVGA